MSEDEDSEYRLNRDDVNDRLRGKRNRNASGDARQNRPRRDQEPTRSDKAQPIFGRKRRRKEYGPVDRMMLETALPLLILFALCCGLLSAAVAVIGVSTAKQPKARERAIIMLCISGFMILLAVAYQCWVLLREQ